MMKVQLAAVELVTYTIEKAGNEKVVPKRNRWSTGDKLVECALDIAMHVDTANTLDLNDSCEATERRMEQRLALASSFRLLTLVHVVARMHNIGDAYMHWTILASEFQKLLRGWMKSDGERRKNGNISI